MKRISIITIVISLFIQLSCKKEIEYIPITRSWSLDSGMYGNNKIILTSVPLNDSVLAVANGYSVTYVYTQNLKYTFTNFINGNDIFSTGLIRPSLNKSVTVAVADNPNNLAIFKTYMPSYLAGLPLFYTPSYSLSDISLKGFPKAGMFNSGYPVIKSKYILAPYEIDFTAQKAALSLIQIDTSWYCNITSKKNIVLDNPSKSGFYSGSYYSWAYYDKFFLTYYGQTYRVDTLGNFKCLSTNLDGNSFEQMFTLNNNLFAFGWKGLFISYDKGETWNLFADISGTNWGWLQYYNVGNEVYGIYLSQIIRVTLTGNTLNFDELDNDGLVGNQITSISKCGKYAFVTTLSGLFYKDTTELNTIKIK